MSTRAKCDGARLAPFKRLETILIYCATSLDARRPSTRITLNEAGVDTNTYGTFRLDNQDSPFSALFNDWQTDNSFLIFVKIFVGKALKEINARNRTLL